MLLIPFIELWILLVDLLTLRWFPRANEWILTRTTPKDW